MERPDTEAEMDELRALLAEELGRFSRRLDRIDGRLRHLAEAVGVELDPPATAEEKEAKRAVLAERTGIERGGDAG